MCPKICELDPSKYLSAPGLAWQVVLENTKVKLYLLAHINMLSMIQKGIREGIYHFICRYAKANNKEKKKYDKNKEMSYLQYCEYWDVGM